MIEAPEQQRSTLQMLRLFRNEKQAPDPFYSAIAKQTVDGLPFSVRGQTLLDLGCGPGYFTEALEAEGAIVVGIDLATDQLAGSTRLDRPLVADGTVLPFVNGQFDGVFCSNMLEHTPNPAGIIAEIERVVRPGGWAYVSWTNWYSPWGGHAITPLHYLGPRLGLKVWRRLFGEPKGRNLPLKNLWVTYVGATLRMVRQRPSLRLVDAFPRYYPSQRWVLSVPVLREIATWNCVMMIERTSDAESSMSPAIQD